MGSTSVVANHEWHKALGQLGIKEAAELFVDVMFNPDTLPHLQKEVWGIRDTFRQLMHRNIDVKNDLIERLKTNTAAPQRLFVASMTSFHEGMEKDLFLAVLENAAATEKETFGLLLRSIEGLATERELIDETENHYNLLPNDLTDLRAKLFKHVVDSTALADIAKAMLHEIDLVRDEYGHPPSEPKHPDITTNRAYPLEAQPFWQVHYIRENQILV